MISRHAPRTSARFPRREPPELRRIPWSTGDARHPFHWPALGDLAITLISIATIVAIILGALP